MFVLGESKALNYWRTYGGFEMILVTADDRVICTKGLIEEFTLSNDGYTLPAIRSNMADLQTDVRYLKGIGEKKAQALNKLGVFTLYDLVSFFPRKYEDRSVYKPIALAQDGESVCIRALVADVPRLTRVRRGLDLVKFRAVDDSGMVDITYFNQSYVKDNLHKGDSYVFYGKMEVKGSKPQYDQSRL